MIKLILSLHLYVSGSVAIILHAMEALMHSHSQNLYDLSNIVIEHSQLWVFDKLLICMQYDMHMLYFLFHLAAITLNMPINT